MKHQLCAGCLPQLFAYQKLNSLLQHLDFLLSSCHVFLVLHSPNVSTLMFSTSLPNPPENKQQLVPCHFFFQIYSNDGKSGHYSNTENYMILYWWIVFNMGKRKINPGRLSPLKNAISGKENVTWTNHSILPRQLTWENVTTGQKMESCPLGNFTA